MKTIVAAELPQTSGGNPRTDFLNKGQSIYRQDRLVSPNGLFSLGFLDDGRLVLRDWNGMIYWDNGRPCNAQRLTFNPSTQLCVYDKSEVIQWASDAQALFDGNGYTTLQNNGNLVIYDTQNVARWQTGTVREIPVLTRNVLYKNDFLGAGDMIVSANKMFRLEYMPNADLVLFDWTGLELWAIRGNGRQAGRALMQDDGNFCTYDANKAFYWGWTTSAASLVPNSYLKLEDSGELVVYSPKGPAVWRLATSKAIPANAAPIPLHTTASCGLVVSNGLAANSLCGGVFSAYGGCGAVMAGIGMCGVVFSGASFCGAVTNAVGACAADAATIGVCGVVAAFSGASVVSLTAVGMCGAVAAVAGVCGAVVSAAGASAIGAGGASACGAVACGAAACGADASGAGACAEAKGSGACGANATLIEGAGVCGAQVGFCGAVLCVAIPLGGNW